MTNITLSIDDTVYKKMKDYSEIRWSEFVRMCIQKRIKELEMLKNHPHLEWMDSCEVEVHEAMPLPGM